MIQIDLPRPILLLLDQVQHGLRTQTMGQIKSFLHCRATFRAPSTLPSLDRLQCS